MAGKAEAPAGYSTTPLWKKLGFRPGMRVCVIDGPPHYARLIDGPNDWILVKQAGDADALHLFITRTDQLKAIRALEKHLPPASMLWVSWPKKTSRLSTGLSEDDIRRVALEGVLVDIKVCAVDADWSGLKLVRRASSPSREGPARQQRGRLDSGKSGRKDRNKTVGTP